MKIREELVVQIELIEEYCKKKKLSKKGFCKLCGISLQSLQKINHKNYKCRTETIEKIAETMEIDICDLFLIE